MITEDQLNAITQRIKEKVWRNDNVMYQLDTDEMGDAIDILSSLHNLLYEAVTGKRYDYAFHWTNKIGADTLDDVFDDILGIKKEDSSNA